MSSLFYLSNSREPWPVLNNLAVQSFTRATNIPYDASVYNLLYSVCAVRWTKVIRVRSLANSGGHRVRFTRSQSSRVFYVVRILNFNY